MASVLCQFQRTEPFCLSQPKEVPDPESDGRRTVDINLDDRSDPIFRLTRYSRWQDLSSELERIFRAVQEQTRAVAQLGAAATGKDYRKLTTFIAKGGESVLQFRALVHGQISSEMVRLIGQHNLPAVVDLEQNMVTEVDDAGDKVSSRTIMADLEALLGSDVVLPTAKARLLMLLLLTAESLDMREWNKLVQIARLPEHLYAALLSAQYVQLPTQRSDRSCVASMHPWFDRKRESARAKSMEQSAEKIRFESKARTAAAQHLEGTLDDMTFPYVKLPPAEHSADPAIRAAAGGAAAAAPSTAAAAAVSSSDRTVSREARDVMKSGSSRRDKQRRRWKDQAATTAAHGGAGDTESDSLMKQLTSETTKQRTGARTIVFFLGGITPLEATQLEALAEATNREIVYGGTAATNAEHFLDQLVQIGEEDSAAVTDEDAL